MRISSREEFLALCVTLNATIFIFLHDTTPMNDVLSASLIGIINFLLGYFFFRTKCESRGPLPAVSSPSNHPDILLKVDSVLNFISLFLPARIMKEDVGDAREVIDKLVAASAPAWMIYTKLASTIFWVLLAAVREVLTVTKKKPN